MARSVVLGNGSLTVALDEKGLVHDFYYPYVGQSNLTTAKSVHHKIGVWVDDIFSWTDASDWEVDSDFETDALISNVTLTNKRINVELRLHDFVDYQQNIFIRRINVKNLADNDREIRIFMHQIFQISRYGRADTALFVPDDNYILNYRGKKCLLVYAQSKSRDPFDQYAVGNYGIEGKTGTYIDAEDGELSNNNVEHGGVDSVIRLKSRIKAQQIVSHDYWIVAASSQFEAEKLHKKLINDGVDARMSATRLFWKDWLSVSSAKLTHIDNKLLPFVKKSLMIIKTHIDKRGGIIASCDSSIYNYGRDYYSYVWPRDGAYIIRPLIRLGHTEEAKKFYEFCRDVLTDDGYLMHKYQPDRSIGSTWHPLLQDGKKELAIQEDETAIILTSLGEFFHQTEDSDFIEGLYDSLIKPAADFICSYIDPVTKLPHASYDLWEEKFATHTYTTAVCYRGLLVAATFAEMFDFIDDATKWRETADDIMTNKGVFYDSVNGNYRKSFRIKNNNSIELDNTLDISGLFGVVQYGLHDDTNELIRSTLLQIEKKLLDQSPAGGSPRYENDMYFATNLEDKGNPWIVTTMWLAQVYNLQGNKEKAKHYIKWATSKSLKSGTLPEQINSDSGFPVSVTPLVWSHSELINTILDVYDV